MPVCGSGAVVCSSSLLLGSHLGCCQAETPLIPLFSFPEPALLAVGTPISGLITVEGAAGRFRFSAEIVRREVETRKLALRFVNPSRSLLDILNRTEK